MVPSTTPAVVGSVRTVRAVTVDFGSPLITRPAAEGDELGDGGGVMLGGVGAAEGVVSRLAIGWTLGAGETSTVSHGPLRRPLPTAAPTASTPTSRAAATRSSIVR